MARRELSSRVSDKCSGVNPTHMSIGYPQAEFSPLHPPSYSCGFSSDGRIIGANLSVPYPRDLPWYHHMPFRRLVDWFTPAIIGDDETEAWNYIRKKEEKRVGGHVDGCDYCRLDETTAQTRTGGKQGCGRRGGKVCGSGGAGQGDAKAQGGGREGGGEEDVKDLEPDYIVKNDPAYKAWVDGKVAAQSARNKAQEEMREVPWEIKLYPGHYAPSVLQTTNEAYGQHLDMLPKRPLVYPEVEVEHKIKPMLVRFRRSNMSDHPPIPDHAFAIDRSEIETLDGEPLRGFLGANFTPEHDISVEAKTCGKEVLKPSDQAKAKQKIPTKTSGCRGVTKTSGDGVKPPAPGFPAPDPWTWRRSTIILGQVVGERQPGCTWPVYTPTGLELNRPIPRTVKMTSGHPYISKRIVVYNLCCPLLYGPIDDYFRGGQTVKILHKCLVLTPTYTNGVVGRVSFSLFSHNFIKMLNELGENFTLS